MSGDPYDPALARHTLIGYALNRLIRGDTPQQAYWSLRRDYNLSSYSTQAISGAVRVAGRLRGIAAEFSRASGDTTLASYGHADLRGCNEVGIRIVYGEAQGMAAQDRSSIIVNVPVGATKENILEAARAALLAEYPGVAYVLAALESEAKPLIYAVLPGGYPTDTAHNLMDLPCP